MVTGGRTSRYGRPHRAKESVDFVASDLLPLSTLTKTQKSVELFCTPLPLPKPPTVKKSSIKQRSCPAKLFSPGLANGSNKTYNPHLKMTSTAGKPSVPYVSPIDILIERSKQELGKRSRLLVPKMLDFGMELKVEKPLKIDLDFCPESTIAMEILPAVVPQVLPIDAVPLVENHQNIRVCSIINDLLEGMMPKITIRLSPNKAKKDLVQEPQIIIETTVIEVQSSPIKIEPVDNEPTKKSKKPSGMVKKTRNRTARLLKNQKRKIVDELAVAKGPEAISACVPEVNVSLEAVDPVVDPDQSIDQTNTTVSDDVFIIEPEVLRPIEILDESSQTPIFDDVIPIVSQENITAVDIIAALDVNHDINFNVSTEEMPSLSCDNVNDSKLCDAVSVISVETASIDLCSEPPFADPSIEPFLLPLFESLPDVEQHTDEVLLESSNAPETCASISSRDSAIGTSIASYESPDAWKIGELAWGRIGPYWPCIVCMDFEQKYISNSKFIPS